MAKEKGLSDRLDLTRLLRTFPELKSELGAVSDRLHARGATARTVDFWREMAHSPLAVDEDETEDADPE